MPPKKAAAAGDAVSNALSELVLGDGPIPPQYARPFTQRNSLKFYQEYEEYARRVELSNLGQSVQRQVLTRSQLFPHSVRSTLSRIYFKDTHGQELEEEDLLEALARHAECWDGGQVDPRVAFSAVTRIMGMGSESTALDRTDVVMHNLGRYLENPSADKVFCESDGRFKQGASQVITKAFVAGLKPGEFKMKAEGILAMRGKWKDDPDAVFEVVRAAATDWRTVEQADKHRNTGRGKHGTESKGASQHPKQQKQRPSNKKLNCYPCGEVGHKSPDCPSSAKPASGSGSSPVSGAAGVAGKSSGRPAGGQQRPRGNQQQQGTPAARGGSQQRPQAQIAPAGMSSHRSVGGRAMLSSDGGANDGEDGSSVLPPDPTPPDSSVASAGELQVDATWRSVAPGGMTSLQAEGFDAHTR